jgi:hypothetical protein
LLEVLRDGFEAQLETPPDRIELVSLTSGSAGRKAGTHGAGAKAHFPVPHEKKHGGNTVATTRNQ